MQHTWVSGALQHQLFGCAVQELSEHAQGMWHVVQSWVRGFLDSRYCGRVGYCICAHGLTGVPASPGKDKPAQAGPTRAAEGPKPALGQDQHLVVHGHC